MSIKQIIPVTLATFLIGYGAANADTAVKKKAVNGPKPRIVSDAFQNTVGFEGIADKLLRGLEGFIYSDVVSPGIADGYTKIKLDGKDVFVNNALIGKKGNKNEGIVYPDMHFKDSDYNQDGVVTADEVKKYISENKKCENCVNGAKRMLSEKKHLLDVLFKKGEIGYTQVAAAAPAPKEAKKEENKFIVEKSTAAPSGLEGSLGLGVFEGMPLLDISGVLLRKNDYGVEINGIVGGMKSSSNDIINGTADPVTRFYSHGEKETTVTKGLLGYGVMFFKKIKERISAGLGIANYHIASTEDVSTVEQIKRDDIVIAEKTNSYSVPNNRIEPKAVFGVKFGSTKEGVAVKAYFGKGKPAASAAYYRRFGKK